MKYFLNGEEKINEENIVVYNTEKALRFELEKKEIIERICSYFTISRTGTEICKFRETSIEIRSMVDFFMKNGLIKSEKINNLIFSNIKIIINESLKGILYRHINKYIDDVYVEEIVISNYKELNNYAFEPDDFVILYLPDTIDITKEILFNYNNNQIKKMLVGIVWGEELLFTCLNPPITACPKCLVNALIRNSEVFKYISSFNGKIIFSNTSNLIKYQLAPVMLVNYLLQIKCMENDNLNPSIVGNLNIYNFKRGHLKTEYIVKEFDCNCIDLRWTSDSYDIIIGNRVGLIKEIKVEILEQTFPPCVLLKAKLPGSKKMVGALDFSWEQAYIRTVGEFIERYCWENYKNGIKLLTWGSIIEKYKLPLDEINVFCDWQYKKLKEVRKLGEDDIIPWIKASNINRDKMIMLPAEFFVNYKNKNYVPLHSISSTGVASGRGNLEIVLKKALFELIERDTITRNIYLKTGILRVNDFKIEENYYVSLCISYGLYPEFFWFSNEYGISVIMCRLVPEKITDEVISYGYACEEEIFSCIIKSLKEALLMRSAIMQDISKNKENSRFIYTLRNSKCSFFNFLNITQNVNLAQIENVKINESAMNRLRIETYFVDITLNNIKTIGWSICSVWNPNLLDFAFERNSMYLNKISTDIELLNEGFFQF